MITRGWQGDEYGGQDYARYRILLAGLVGVEVLAQSEVRRASAM